jgi:hypothetical protein
LLYFVAAFGLAYLVGHSVISAPIRSFIGGPIDKPRAYLGLIIALLECPACFGTWTGMAIGSIRPEIFLQSSWSAGAVVAACATAGVNFILGSLTGLMPHEEDPMKARVAEMLEALSREFYKPMPVVVDDVLHEQPTTDTLTAHDVEALRALEVAQNLPPLNMVGNKADPLELLDEEF